MKTPYSAEFIKKPDSKLNGVIKETMKGKLLKSLLDICENVINKEFQLFAVFTNAFNNFYVFANFKAQNTTLFLLVLALIGT